jgi:hypothetical protein
LCGVGDLAEGALPASSGIGGPWVNPCAAQRNGGVAVMRATPSPRVTTVSAVAPWSSAGLRSAVPPRVRPRVASTHRLPRASRGVGRRPSLAAPHRARHLARTSRPRAESCEVVVRPSCTSREGHLLATSAFSVCASLHYSQTRTVMGFFRGVSGLLTRSLLIPPRKDSYGGSAQGGAKPTLAGSARVLLFPLSLRREIRDRPGYWIAKS